MFGQKLLEAPRNTKKLLMLASDLAIIPLALYLSIGLRTDFSGEYFSKDLHYIALLTALTSSWLFMRIGLYLAAVRFMGHEAMRALLWGVTASTLILFGFINLLNESLPVTVPLLYWGVAFCLVGGTRFAVR